MNYWRLGETSGTAAADSAGSNPGTYVGTPTLNQTAARVSMSSNPSIRLNGTNQYVNMGDINDFTGTAAFTVEAWVKRDAASTSYDRIASKEGTSGSFRTGWSMYMRPATDGYTVGIDRFDATATNDTVGSTSRMELNRWYHVVASYGSSQLKIYVNGVLEGTSASTRSLANTASPFRIGSDQNGASVFHGGIDDVSVYNSALPLATVQSHHKGCASVSYATPAHVQSKRASPTNNLASLSTGFASNNTAGNLIAVFASWNNGNSGLVCSDTAGNSYTNAIVQAGAGGISDRIGVCYATNIAGGANTVTANFGSTSSKVRLAIHEYSNVATTSPVDASRGSTASSVTSGTDATTTGTVTTTTPNSLIFGAMAMTGTGNSQAAGTNFTERTRLSHIENQSQDRILASAGSVASTWTMSASAGIGYMAVVVAFKPKTI